MNLPQLLTWDIFDPRLEKQLPSGLRGGGPMHVIRRIVEEVARA